MPIVGVSCPDGGGAARYWYWFHQYHLSGRSGYLAAPCPGGVKEDSRWVAAATTGTAAPHIPHPGGVPESHVGSTYTNLLVHIVFATKGRNPTLVAPDLHTYIGGIARRLGTTPLAIGGVSDHVHLLLLVKATHQVADIVREIKKGTSAWLKDLGTPVAWQEGYGAFSIGRSERDIVDSYIRRQEEHHRRESSSDELRRLLAEHGVEFDERFFE